MVGFKKKRRGISHGSLDAEEGGFWGIPLHSVTYPIVVEVKEMERFGDTSRVKVVSITGCPRSYQSRVKALVPEWIKTNEIVWLTES